MELLSYNTIITFFTTIVLLVTIFYYYARYKLNYWTRLGVEQLPNPHIIFGHVKDAMLFRTALGYHMGQLYRSAKPDLPYVGFYIFHKPCLLIRDPEVAKQMFVTDFETFSDRHFSGSEQVDSFGMLNLFDLKNPAWKFLRSKISPALTKGKLRQMYPLMIETSEPMMQYLKGNEVKGSDESSVDIEDLVFRYTIDSIANIALGTKTDSLHNPNTSYTQELIRVFHESDRMRVLITVFYGFDVDTKPSAFMEFGIGLRICVGGKMDMLYTKLVFSKILMNDEIYQIGNKVEIDKRGTLSIVAGGINVEYKSISYRLDDNNNSIKYYRLCYDIDDNIHQS